MARIIRNAAKCHDCGVTVESKHRHDFQECECGNIFVDGGLDYLRRGWKYAERIEDLSLVEEDGPTIESSGDQWTDSTMMGDTK